MRKSFPEAPPAEQEPTCAVLVIPTYLIPFTAGLFAPLENRRYWLSDDDHERGYAFAASCQEQLMTNCLTNLVEAQERIYRLLDTSINGTLYEVTGTDPVTQRPIIEPVIPDVPPELPNPALRPLLDRAYNAPLTGDPPFTDPGLLEILRNFQGTIGAGWFGIGGQKATLANVVEALRIGNEATKVSLWQKMQGILDAGSDTALVAGFLEDLLADSVDALTDGGILGVLIGSSLANAAIAGDLAGKLNRIIASLDGGGLTGPDDNVLEALRGTIEANSNHNVIDILNEIRDRLIEADPEDDSLLEEIRKLLV